jgi:phosphate starvation-inducible PhoH-like protein
MPRKPSVKPRNKKVNLDEELFETPTQKQKNNFDILSFIKLDIKHKNETQKKLTLSIKNNDVTICTGPAGCGKTYVAVAEAIKLIKEDANYKKIVIIKSVTNLKGEEIGFLKGTLDEKMEPFIYSFISNFNKLIGIENTNILKERKIIETLPIAYLRGVSIDDSIIIVDEIQNITHDNMKTILTRLGENSKLILLGDTEQIDIKNKKESSVSNLISKIKLKPSPNVGIIEFNEAESVRHKLTPYFIDLLREDKQIEKSIKIIEKTPKKEKKFSGVINLIRNFFIK